MTSDIAMILVAVILATFGAYKMWKLPRSNRKYVIVAIIGVGMLLIAFSLRAWSDTFADWLTIAGAVVGCIALYKNYKHRTS